MKFLKTIAVGACALVALAAGVSSATAGQPAKTRGPELRPVVGSCDDADATGEVSIADGVANLNVPEQMSWAQVRTFPQGLKLSDLKTPQVRSKVRHPGVV